MTLWAAQWRSESKRDGKDEWLIRELRIPKLFTTRKEARSWIEFVYGYIRTRPDLRAEPHGWKMPRAVKVTVREEL